MIRIYSKKYGRIPQNISNLPDNNANFIAGQWSYEPEYLLTQKELSDAKAWVVNVSAVTLLDIYYSPMILP